MRGGGLLRLARDWFDEGTVSRVFEPLIADWQRECESLSGLRGLGCRASGYAAFVASFIQSFAAQFPRRLPVGLTTSTWLVLELFAGAGVFLLYAIPMIVTGEWRQQGAFPFAATLGIALPLAVVPMAIVISARSKATGPDRRTAIVRVAMICTLAMGLLAGWIIPNTNQQRRESSLRAQRIEIARGERELTVFELFSPATPHDYGGGPARRQLEAQNRISIIVMPLTLTVLGLAVGRPRRLLLLQAMAWWGFACLCWLGTSVLTASRPWQTHVLLICIAVLMVCVRRQMAWATHASPLQ